jgi:hypothetical protein
MKTYLVSSQFPIPTGTVEYIEEVNNNHFQYLKSLCQEIPEEIIIINELPITGIAVVNATDKSAKLLELFGYLLEEIETIA